MYLLMIRMADDADDDGDVRDDYFSISYFAHCGGFEPYTVRSAISLSTLLNGFAGRGCAGTGGAGSVSIELSYSVIAG